MSRTQWGTAGVRRTPEEAARRNGLAVLRNETRIAKQAEDDRIAYEKWRVGMVVPSAITRALDMHGLYGPEVDEACGVREPAVDLWEAGKLYPTWEQLRLLAKLTGYPPLWFVTLRELISVLDTSMVYHLPRSDRNWADMQLITRYPDDVWQRCPGTGLPEVSS